MIGVVPGCDPHASERDKCWARGDQKTPKSQPRHVRSGLSSLMSQPEYMSESTPTSGITSPSKPEVTGLPVKVAIYGVSMKLPRPMRDGSTSVRTVSRFGLAGETHDA